MTLTQLFTLIANAIRNKTGSSSKIMAEDFPDEISNISTGTDTSDATATENDIISPKTAYVNGEKITGNIITETKQEGTITYKRLVSNSVFSDYNYNNSINSDNLLAIAKNATVYIYQINADGTLTEKCTYVDSNNYTVTTVLLTDGVAVNDTKHYLLIYSTVYDGSTAYQLPYHMFKELVKKADGTYEIIDTAIQGTKDDGFSNGPFNANVVAKKTLENGFIIAEIGGGNASDIFIYYVATDANGNFTNNKTRITNYHASRDNITYDFRFLNTANPILYYRASKFGNNCIINFTSVGSVASVYSFTPTVSDMNLFSICYDENTGKFIECEKVNNIISFYELSLNNNVLTKGNSLGTISDTSANKIVLEYYKEYFILKCINSTQLLKTIKTCNIVNGEIAVKNSFSQNIRSVGYYNAMTNNPYGRIDQNCTYNSDFLVTGTNNSYVGTLNVDNITTTKAIIGNDTLLNTVGATAGASNILVGKTAYVDNAKITGTMPNNGALNYTPGSSAQTIPAGYTSGGTVAAMDITTSNDYETCLGLSEQIMGDEPVPEYTELEYIESSGTQYIDTLYKPNHYTRTEMSVETIKLTGTFVPFGTRASGELDYVIGINFNSRNYIQYNSNDAIYSTEDSSQLLNTKILVQLDNSSGEISYNDKNISIIPTNRNNFYCTTNLYLGCSNNNGSPQYIQNYKLYYCKIYENTRLIHDYIPVKDPNNVVCLYDKVSGEYFYNAGTGTFIAGGEVQ